MGELEQVHHFSDFYHMLFQREAKDVVMRVPTEKGYRSVTREHYRAAIEAAAAELRDAYLPSGSFVGLKAGTSPQFMVWFWAILRAGHNPLLLDPRAPAERTKMLMHEVRAAALVATGEWLNEDEAPDYAKLFTESEKTPFGLKLARGKLTDETPRLQPETFYDHKAIPFGAYVVIATSGTTGAARLFVHSGNTVARQMEALLGQAEYNDRWLRPDGQERSLAIMPFHHILGFTVVFMLCLTLGNIVVFPKDKSPESWLETCREQKITQLVSVPMFWNHVVRGLRAHLRALDETGEEAFEQLIRSSLQAQQAGVPLPPPYETKLQSIRSQLLGDDLRLGCTGGGRISGETLRTLAGLGYFIVNGYGLTETGVLSVDHGCTVQDRTDGSVGPAIRDDMLRLNDKNEVEVHADFLHCGIIQDGRYVPTSYDADHPFGTGDVGELDENGRLFVRGRLRDIIVGAAGENVNPDDIEMALEPLPGVERLCVLGVQRADEEIIALVLEPGVSWDEARLIEALRRRIAGLPAVWRPHVIYVSEAPLPLSAALKVRRRELSDALAESEAGFSRLSLVSAKKPVDVDKRTASEKAESVSADRIRQLMSEILLRPTDEIALDDDFVLDLRADSLQCVSLHAALEKEFDITLDDRDFADQLSADAIASMLKEGFEQGDFDRVRGRKPRRADTTLREEEIYRGRAGSDARTERVERFEDSREYKAFALRQKTLAPILEHFGNPYFVAHDSPLRDKSLVNGHPIINFASYNYLALSGDPEVNEAAIRAIKMYGTSASGSRLLAGEKTIHKELEKSIADWKRTEDAIVLVGGHSTNVTFVGNFCNERDLILYDVLSHNSVDQGIRLSRADAQAFPHNDTETLDSILKRRRDDYEKVLIVIEGAYSMDGDVAPVPEFVELKKRYGAFLMVDEAHSAGVLGEHGGGVDEHFGLAPDDIDIKMGTLSKTLGACGGYLAGKRSLIDYLRYNVPGFVFSVGISPALAGAVLKSIEIIRRDNSRVQALHRNIDCFMREAKARGFDTCLAGESPITPILIGDDETAFRLTMEMLDEGVFVPPAVYPAVARGQARLRYCLTSAHREEQIVYALDLLRRHFDPTS